VPQLGFVSAQFKPLLAPSFVIVAARATGPLSPYWVTALVGAVIATTIALTV
jgi:hypothetical protein